MSTLLISEFKLSFLSCLQNDLVMAAVLARARTTDQRAFSAAAHPQAAY